jgi:hypothetical protein
MNGKRERGVACGTISRARDALLLWCLLGVPLCRRRRPLVDVRKCIRIGIGGIGWAYPWLACIVRRASVASRKAAFATPYGSC